ncbi:MAG TPA: hypothetical protein VGE29_14585 [Prosthecobacter sp.]
MDTNEWISSTLMDFENFYPEQLGEKQLIFSSGGHEPLISLYMDPPPVAARWNICEGMDFTESLFHRLKPWAQKHGGTWFIISLPQEEYTILNVLSEYEERFWCKAWLRVLENISPEGGTQYLGFLAGDRDGALIFKRKPGLEISFYGTAAHRAEISAALGL